MNETSGETRSFTSADRRFMRRALALARAVKGGTFPNPAVGAVIVRNGRVVGSGRTAPCGGPHAERQALQSAGRRAKGATLYVTLEPCCHHGRTPPCTCAIIEAGVTRVVFAVRDANPLVAGKGCRQLRRRGIAVESGLLEREAAQLNEDHQWAIRRHRAWVTVKLAMTLDGRIADRAGRSRWITGAQSRRFAHELRRRHAGIAVGRATVLRDDPLLTVRHISGPSPVRFVFSSTAGLPPASRLARTAGRVRADVVVAGGAKPDTNGRDGQVEIWHTGTNNPARHLDRFLRMAYQSGLTGVLIEGGQKLASAFMKHRLANRVCLFYGNKLLGDGKAGMLFDSVPGIGRAVRLTDISWKRYGEDLCVTGIPRW